MEKRPLEDNPWVSFGKGPDRAQPSNPRLRRKRFALHHLTEWLWVAFGLFVFLLGAFNIFLFASNLAIGLIAFTIIGWLWFPFTLLLIANWWQTRKLFRDCTSTD